MNRSQTQQAILLKSLPPPGNRRSRGSQLLLDIAVGGAGVFRSGKPNVVDLVLPPMLARYRVTGRETVCLGMGGLLA